VLECSSGPISLAVYPNNDRQFSRRERQKQHARPTESTQV
jgi:hypothetical protein